MSRKNQNIIGYEIIMKVITQFKNTRKFKIISTKIAGIVLSGDEIKSIRDRKISINEAFILPHNQELYLRDVYIASYQYANLFGKQHQDKRKRKLLLNKREIDYLISQMRSKHYNLIPLQVFVNERG